MIETTAVVDGISRYGPVRILVGPEERELHIRPDQLPPEAGEGTILKVVLENNKLLRAWIDQEATIRTQERIKQKRETLLRRGHGPDTARNIIDTNE